MNTEQVRPADSRQGTAPLWTNERINVYINDALASQPNHTPRGLVRRVLYTIRDEYETKLDEYQAVYLYYIDLAHKTDERIANLQAAYDLRGVHLEAAHDRIATLENAIVVSDPTLRAIRDEIEGGNDE